MNFDEFVHKYIIYKEKAILYYSLDDYYDPSGILGEDIIER